MIVQDKLEAVLRRVVLGKKYVLKKLDRGRSSYVELDSLKPKASISRLVFGNGNLHVN